jgi:hypothetical protein
MRSSTHQRISQTPAVIHQCRRLFAFLTLALLLAAKGASADRALCTAGFLRVLSPDAQSVTVGQCQAVARQTMDAWKFDANRMRWAPWIQMDAPVTMRLIGIARMKTEHAGVLGFARGRDLFVVSTAVLDDPFANGTLAHELAHIQAKRALGRHSEEKLVPRYFIEGHGNWMGRAYRDYLHVTEHHYDLLKARLMMRFTSEDARTILTDDSYAAAGRANEDQMEAMGIFFVEYLRVRHHETDTILRMGRVFEKVGRGSSYANAFREEFGVPIDRVVAEIVSFVERTESHPAERLRGTLYQEFSQPINARR